MKIFFLFISASILLSGCQKALIYGESTNFSLATLKVNSDVAEPLAINAGYDRSVAAVSPPKGTDANGKEAMNMVSHFELTNDAEPFGTLAIATEFASGKAATNMVNFNPDGAAGLMKINFVKPIGPAAAALRGRLIEKVNNSNDTEALDKVATDMDISPIVDARTQVIQQLNQSTDAMLTGYKTTVEKWLGALI